jgi:hypothetical protein
MHVTQVSKEDAEDLVLYLKNGPKSLKEILNFLKEVQRSRKAMLYEEWSR